MSHGAKDACLGVTPEFQTRLSSDSFHLLRRLQGKGAKGLLMPFISYDANNLFCKGAPHLVPKMGASTNDNEKGSF